MIHLNFVIDLIIFLYFKSWMFMIFWAISFAYGVYSGYQSKFFTFFAILKIIIFCVFYLFAVLVSMVYFWLAIDKGMYYDVDYNLKKLYFLRWHSFIITPLIFLAFFYSFVMCFGLKKKFESLRDTENNTETEAENVIIPIN